MSFYKGLQNLDCGFRGERVIRKKMGQSKKTKKNMEYIKLQAQAITGTSFDPITNTVNILPPEEWRKIKEQYMNIAAQHYKNCRFPDGNVFRQLFPKEAKKIEGEKVK